MRESNFSARASGGALALVVLAGCTLAFLFEGLFLERSLLGIDNRLFPPFTVHRSADEPPPGPMNFLSSDINGFILPETIAQWSRWEEGEVPLWNPYQNLGQPLLADMGYAPFYPAVLLGLWFEPMRAYAVSMALHLFLLGWGAWRLFRSRELAAPAALLGALTLAFGGFATVHLHLPNFVRVLAWLPWILLSFDRLAHSATLRRTGILALQLACCFLAGFPQLSFLVLYLGLASFGWTLLRANAGFRLRALICAGAATVLGGAASSVQVLPAAELLDESWRSEGLSPEQAERKRLEPESLVAVLLPQFFGSAVSEGGAESRRLEEFPTYEEWLEPEVQNNFIENTSYIGLVPLALVGLALGALLRGRGRRGDGFHLGVASVALAVMLGVPGISQGAALLPGLGVGSPKRAMAIVGFCCAWLAASELDRRIRSTQGGRNRGLLIFGAAFVGLGLAAFLPFEQWLLPQTTADDQQWFRTTVQSDLFAAALAGVVLIGAALLLKRAPRLGFGALILAAAVDLVWFGREVNPSQPLHDQYRATPGIEWLRNNGASDQYRVMTLFTDHLLGGNFGQVFGFRMAGGVSAMVDRESGELLRVLDPALMDPEDPRFVGALQNPLALQSPLLDLLGVRYLAVSHAGYQLLSSPDAAPLGLTMVHYDEAEMMALFERPSALPPAFFVERLRVVGDANERLNRLGDPAFEPAVEAIVEEPVEGPMTGLSVGAATYRRLEPECIEVELETGGPAFLVLSESHFPGWRAEIDGEACTLHRVDHALMGVTVPTGGSTLRLTYAPASFRIGTWISALSVLTILGLLIRRR